MFDFGYKVVSLLVWFYFAVKLIPFFISGCFVLL